MLKGWNYERFGKSEVEAATGSPWIVDLNIDNTGFGVTIVRWQVTYVRKWVRKAEQQAWLDADKSVVY